MTPVPSSPLQGVISSCLQLDPSRRPHSAEEVLELLRGIAEPHHPAAPVEAPSAASVDVTSDAPTEPDYSYDAAPPELPAVGIPAAYRGLRRAADPRTPSGRPPRSSSVPTRGQT